MKEYTQIDKDIHDMHAHYGIDKAVKPMDDATLAEMLRFRLDFLKEELTETYEAFHNRDPEEVVDGLIDLIVVAVGTLDLYEVDVKKAWDQVHNANMNKKVGIKEGRPNPLGLPDLVKDPGWQAPCHEGNWGRLDDALDVRL